MSRFQYIIRRLLLLIPLLVGVSFLSFCLLMLSPGDVVDILLEDVADSAEVAANMRKELGLDKPLPVQYGRWIARVAQGNLGRSLTRQTPVMEEIIKGLPVTLELSILAASISILLGVPAGVLSAIHNNRGLDAIIRISALLGRSLPSYVLATLFILLVSTHFRSVRIVLYVPFSENPFVNLQQMIFPALSLGIGMSIDVMRMARSSMLDVLRKDYITTARSKGLSELVVNYRHALRTAFNPVLTVIGFQIGHLLGGAIIIETIFALPGIGMLLIDALLLKDFTIVQGVILFLAFNFVVINLIIDILYSILDPRIRYE